jgi:hypothetical protein
LKLISHRGNLNGKYPERENTVEYIHHALELGYDVEIDVWYDHNHGWWLGHDFPQYQIDKQFLSTAGLWVHCKNAEALDQLANSDINFFFHENDPYTLTSKGWIWAYPGYFTSRGICVLPEIKDQDVSNFQGVCSDFIARYK